MWYETSFLNIIQNKGVKLSSNKSFSSETSERYSRALFELATENSELDSTEKNISELLDLYTSNSELKKFIKNPTQSQASQLEVINKISLSMNLSKITTRFLSILVLKRRIFFLEKIIRNFLSFVSRKKGILEATLVSSKKLTEEELNNLNSELTKVIGSQVNFNHKIEENLLGGLKIQVGSLMIDTSIKSKLKKYEQIMTEA